MAHFKCDACRIRVNPPDGRVGVPACPECGALLEPVSRLQDLMGFQAADEISAARWTEDGGALAESVALPPPDSTR